jgi:branched-chain amino acid transport system ATP-binding protein
MDLAGIIAGYSGNQVLHGVDIAVKPGELVLVLGPNGAGKSTLLGVASGLVRQTSGRISLDGSDISSLKPHVRARRGIAFVPEGRRIFAKQSVHDNLLIGTVARGGRGPGAEESFQWVFEVFPILFTKRNKFAATLSGGEQQMLAIAQGLMSQPRVLLLDEPSGGLAPILVKQVFERCRALVERGISILMVEQTAGAIAIADRVYIMRGGLVVDEGAASEMQAGELGERYLGTGAWK